MAKNTLSNVAGASIQSIKQADNSYKYYMVIQHANGVSRNEIEYDTASSLIAQAGSKNVSILNTSDTNTSYIFNSNYARQNIIQPLEESAGISSKFLEHSIQATETTKNTNNVIGEYADVILVGKTKVTDVTDEYNTVDTRTAGKVNTGVNASRDVIPNNTGKGGAGGTKGAGFEGDGTGANDRNAGTGLGIGSGNGNGIGDGNLDGVEIVAAGKGAGVNKDGTAVSTAAVSNTSNSDVAAISSYLEMINGETAINHIFHNDFYSNQPIAHWAYSVDFIPTISSDALTQTDLFEIGNILTKAVQTVSIPERQIQSTVSHYKGMTIELPSRAKTCGTLNMKFAENDVFMVSTVLNTLFQFARSDDYFESIDYKLSSMNISNPDQIELVKQILRAYRAALPKGGHLFNILVKLYKMKDTKALDDVDSTQYPTFVYFYKGCDVKSVKSIEFNYDDDKPIDVGCEWLYQYFEEMSYDEYLLRYGSAQNDNSNINVLESEVDAKFKPFDDSGLKNAQKSMNNLINGAKNSSILDKYLFGENAHKFYDNSTENRSPANMTPENAELFVNEYAPKSPITQNQISFNRRGR